MRGAYAAGKLSVGFWDHWVPDANDATETLIKEWAEKEKVEVQIDFITSQGNKLLLTDAAEAQAKSGHDILALTTWLPARYAEQLVPMNDVMEPLIKAERRGQRHRRVSRQGRRQVARRAGDGRQPDQGAVLAHRPHEAAAGIDVQAMYPAGAPPKADDWTLDTFLKAAEACHKGGHPFGIGARHDGRQSSTPRARSSTASAPMLVDAKGDITVKSDAVRQALDYYKKLMAFLPPDVPAWDDASNNKLLVSGQGALIMNPPSAWAVAKRDAPQGRRAVLDARLRRPGRRAASRRSCRSSGASGTSARTSRRPRACSTHLSQADVGREDGDRQRRLRPAVVREAHHLQDVGRGGAAQGHALSLSQPAQPPDPVGRRRARAAQDRRADLHPGASQTQMAVRYFKGEAMEKTLDWAAKEIEGFMRN